ncbi:MAG: YfhO family protein [Verrucomicrobia subdivision 3 bacterium]|nr:YfhO family protein [Limisphaerales bacterium]
MTLYPFSLIYLLFPLPWSLGYFCLGHLFLGGMGMYCLARRWTQNDFAAAFAAVAFIFNGVTFSSLIWPNYTVALGWMPWIVLLSQSAWPEGGRKLVVAAVVGALQMMSGVPELILLTWLVVGAMWLAKNLQVAASGRDWIRSGGRLVLLVVLIAGLTAVQLMPFMDLLAMSQRGRDYATAKWAMPGWGWANLLLPLFHTFKSYQGPCFQHDQNFMSSYYPGAAILVLAAWAAWWVRTWRVRFLGGLTLLSLILALGDNGVLYTWLKGALPVMGFARFPIKFVLLAAFTIPLLGAFAVANPGRPTDPRMKSLLIIGAAVLILMALLLWFAGKYPFPAQRWTDLWQNSVWRAAFLISILGSCIFVAARLQTRFSWIAPFAALGLVALDCLTHTARQNPTIPTQWFSANLWQQRNSVEWPGGRVLITPEAERRLLVSRVQDPLHDFIGKRLALWSNLNMIDGIPKVNGSSTLQIREQFQFERSLYQTNQSSESLPENTLNFLGVSYISGSNTVDWIKRSEALPLVTAGQRAIFDFGSNALKFILATNTNLRTEVCLPLELRGVVKATNAGVANVHEVKVKPQHVSFVVEAAGPAMVVIAQTWHPGWRAKVGGVAAPVWRANYTFQALEVPAGQHKVVLDYREPRLFCGSIISLATLLLSALLWTCKKIPLRSHSTGEGKSEAGRF